ncbi:MAG: hypothetical protein WBA74_18720, partial [Cyclobacteriaceae bacterium]
MNFLQRAFLSVLMMSFVFLLACGDDESGTAITSIKLTVRPAVDFIESGTELSLSASDQNGNDISEIVTFLVNEAEIEGTTFTPTSPELLKITASYEGINSTVVSLDVINKVESITVTSDKEIISPSGKDFATITAKDQAGLDITPFVNFYVNGSLSSTGNLISSVSEGELTITAKYKEIESNGLTLISQLEITSLRIEVDQATIPADSYTKAHITVLNQSNIDITEFSTIYVNDKELVSNVFTSGDVGSYQIKAVYEGLESDLLSLQVNPFTVRKVLIEEFTGEWCGWCPEAAYNLDELVKEHPYVLTVGIHNGDGLVYNNEDIIRNAFGINGFPGGIIGRVNLPGVGYNSSPMSPAITNEFNRQIYDETVLAGVEISSTINGNELDIDVNVQFYEQVTDEVRVTIYIVENNVVGGTQQNYFSNNTGFENYYYYPKPPQLPNFVHQYV